MNGDATVLGSVAIHGDLLRVNASAESLQPFQALTVFIYVWKDAALQKGDNRR